MPQGSQVYARCECTHLGEQAIVNGKQKNASLENMKGGRHELYELSRTPDDEPNRREMLGKSVVDAEVLTVGAS